MRDPWSVIALTLYLISVFPAHAQVSPRLVPEMGLSGIDSVAFSPNGHLVLTGSLDNSARLWDAETGGQVRSFLGHTSTVLSVTFSPDDRYVLTGSRDHTARLWDVSTGKQVRSIGHEDEVESVAFSKDGQYLVTTCADTVVRIWDTATGELRRSSPKIGAIPLSAVFSPDGRYVLAGMNDNIAMLWDISSGGRVLFTGPQLSGILRSFLPSLFLLMDVRF